MITDSHSDFLNEFRKIRLEKPSGPHTMKAAMLVDPTGMKISAESATDNLYMDTALNVDMDKAFREHHLVGQKINELGIPVLRFPGKDGMDDGIFPNNVFATTKKKLVVGRMFHPVRQREATREDIKSHFKNIMSYKVDDLSGRSHVCELTGSLAIDRAYDISLVGLSSRCSKEGSLLVHDAMGHRLSFQFELTDDEYHTNIVLAVLASQAIVIYPGSFKNQDDADTLIEAWGDGAIVIDEDEKNHFVGNCISITEKDALFSQTAIDAMKPETRAKLESLGFNIHGTPCSEIEKSGGSLRCLIAEIF